MDLLARSREFIFKNARPLDLARWNYLFEGGDRQDVFRYLAAYQNPDGGFGGALEPDCWNPQSSPLQTWVATKIVTEVDWDRADHPLIAGILDYLSSGREFDGHRWHGLNTVAANNDFPHAPWWACTKEQETSYNPTASLIGFMLRYAEQGSPAHALACSLLGEVYRHFKEHFPLESMHEAACYTELYRHLKACGQQDLVDMAEFKALLQQQIKHSITYDTDCWSTDYICKPSLFIRGKSSDFYPENRDICSYECSFIRQTQNADGSWNVTWSWDKFAEEWAVSKNWWKSDIIIQNIAYIKATEG